MHRSLTSVGIKINECIYLKDPESSDLGKKIITGSIDLIDEIGFEAYTFRKLAKIIQSTEASIYRYFENKHKLLLYLTSWYWSWMEYRLVFRLANIPSAVERLKIAVSVLTETVTEDGGFSHIDEVKLNRIVIEDSSKVYLTRNVDEENKEGVYLGYKNLVGRVSDIISEIDPKFKYPHMLISTVVEGAHHQRFFAQHLPRLTDVVEGEDSIIEFYTQMVLSTIQTSSSKKK